MINKEYTIKEAFEKKLIISGEEVSLKHLYIPDRCIFEESYGSSLNKISLEAYFKKRSDDGMKGRIYLETNNSIFVELRVDSYDNKEAEIISKKLLFDELFVTESNFRSTNGEIIFKIIIKPETIVKFVGEEEEPYLELPPHKAYYI